MTTPQIDWDGYERAVREGKIVRGQWRDHDRLCALLTLVPAAEIRSGADYSVCAAAGLPEWCAQLVPWIDDAVSIETWRDTLVRLGVVLRRAVAVLTPEDWARLDYVCRAIAVREARARTPHRDPRFLAAIDRVLALLDRAAAGDASKREQWCAAAWEAWEATQGTMAATPSTAAAAWAAKFEASEAAARTAAAASVAVKTTAAADRIAAAMLDAIEARCAEREA
jgi:hypothetical protein